MYQSGSRRKYELIERERGGKEVGRTKEIGDYGVIGGSSGPYS